MTEDLVMVVKKDNLKNFKGVRIMEIETLYIVDVVTYVHVHGDTEELSLAWNICSLTMINSE